jgi:hydrogenase expression/formation protein HypD
MKYLDEFRSHALAQNLLTEISRTVTKPWVIMEVCGGQTHSIVKYGLDELLPPEIELAHGPGCPVCVTSLETIDRAHALARRPDIVFCSFGDMLRVPGSSGDLFQIKALGGNVRVIYSPLDCLKLARENPDKQVVFFAIGFETTAPANAMSVWLAREQGIANYSILASHVTVPPAMTTVLESPGNRVQAFLGAGHVCAVMGWEEYEPLAAQYRVPIVITGFEPLDLLEGILMSVRQLETGRHEVENQYSRAVLREGNKEARRMIERVFEPCDRAWRGIGEIPGSGYRLREEFAAFDATRIFHLETIQAREPEICISGLVLQGARRPPDCPAFGTQCTPETPLGATMVSSEGACAAYYNYRRRK